MALAREFRRAIEPVYGDRLKDLRVAVEPVEQDDPSAEMLTVNIAVVVVPTGTLGAEIRRLTRVAVRLGHQFRLDVVPTLYSEQQWAQDRERLERCSVPVAA